MELYLTGPATYRSGDPKVAEVEGSSGKVTIIKPGQVRIYADAQEGSNYLPGSTGYDLIILAPPSSVTPTPTPKPSVTPTPTPKPSVTPTPTPKPSATPTR